MTVSPKVDVNKWYETLKNQALDRNYKSAATWSKYKNDLAETKSLLSLIPRKVNHDVMVPIGSKALMPGKIVHTNEFLVNLGATWFVTRTAFQSIEICDRRIKKCDEMLKKLETEMQLILNRSSVPAEKEAFGNEERPEIIEYVTEEENEEWKKQHRLKEKKYRQQLAELRNQEKKKIETEEDLWKHLDELELQEELEDELNRLNAENDDDDYNENNLEQHSLDEQNKSLDEGQKDNPEMNETKETNQRKNKKIVSFSSDYDLSEDEPLRLEIRHSEVEPVPSHPNSTEIISPSDIYNNYKKICNKSPKSVLKKSSTLNNENNYMRKKEQIIETKDSDSEECSESETTTTTTTTTTTSFVIKDVIERNSYDKSNIQNSNYDTKKVSKFKSLRMKN